MNRTTQAYLFLAALLLCGGPLFAQESAGEGPAAGPGIETEPDYEGPLPTLYQAGDKTFIISAGVVFPAWFWGDISSEGHGLGAAGGTGFLTFNFYLTPHIYWGLELGGMVNPTKGGNMLFIIPFGARIGYQFILKRFEFPITLMIGAAPQKYLEKGYFGFFMKPGFAVYWRFNPEWSFGVNADLWYVPQTPKNGKNATGTFGQVTLAARYHL
ncbi:MAG: hypothetical protein LBR16_02940 [Treponema sp.]|jgi:hypothetical protein|nr:hypothetical protein [Treponema sp.]